MSGRGLLGALALVVATVVVASASAEEIDAVPPAPAPATATAPAREPAPARAPDPRPENEIDLDTLLKLPAGFGEKVETRQGATRLQWRDRFAQVRGELATSRKELARVEKELDLASETSSAWQVSAPGATSPENSPLSFKLRQEVKDLRNEILDGERRLRALAVEADLANVPLEWRE